MTIPTIKIARPDNERGGYAIINESDFDPDKHVAFGEETAEEPLTREDIAEMDKPDVREILNIHGVEHDGRANIDDLRNLAIATVFVEL